MKSRSGFGVLAVCALMLGMMTISVSGAQAGQWMVAGKNVSGELKIEASIEIEPLGLAQEVHLVLLSTSGGNKVAILCGEISDALGTVTPTAIQGSLKINKCFTFINEVRQKPCDPVQPILASGELTVLLHAGSPYAIVENVLVPFKFKCAALPATVTLGGDLWLEDCNLELEAEKVTHLAQEAKVPAKALGGLFFGLNQATIDGSVNIAFSDPEHKGLKFNGLAE